MRITSVALENIKSYQKVEVLFSSGTTAIRGHNGSGKSTLVEAIGFALFDALNYSQDQFVREGERYGQVTVSFLSAEDDREYQAVRRCGSSPTWYIYDPELQMRVVEQKTDVNDFLRRHLRIETDISLRDLFNDALGIPQGTFTADFLLSPANRKKKFDTLLQIEDYRKAAEKLNETRGYLQEERHAIEKRISELERETSQLETWRAALADLRRQQLTLGGELQKIEQESARVEQQYKALLAQRDTIQKLDNEVQLAGAKNGAAAKHLDNVTRLLEEAREAARNRDAASRDYQRYLRAQKENSVATKRGLERDELEKKRSDTAGKQALADRDLQNARQRLDEACRAEERLQSLAPLVERQSALEREHEKGRAQIQRGDEISRRLQRSRQSVESAAANIRASEKTIAALELLRPEAESLDQWREHLAMLQDHRARQSERKKRLSKITMELREVSTSREKAVANEARLEENVRKIRANQSVALQLPELEDSCQVLLEQVRQIEARRDQHQRSSEASFGGNCPFLQEPCLNIQRKGISSLGSYFDRLIAKEEEALATTRDQLADLEVRRDHSREVRKYYDKLDLYEQQLLGATEQRNGAEKRLAELEAEQREILELEKTTPSTKDLAEAQQRFKESDEADKRLRELEPRRTELARLQAQQADMAQEITGFEADLAAIEPVRAALAQIEKDLVALQDPRSACVQLQPLAGGRSAYQAQVQSLEQQVQALLADLARVEKQLLPYAEVQSELERLRKVLEDTQPGYQRYLQYEKLAEQVPARKAAAGQAEKEAEAARQGLARAQAAYKAACASFDEQALKRAEGRSGELKKEDASKREQLRQLLGESQKLEAEIARVEAMQATLASESREYATVGDLEQMLQHFRDVIREAGPNIMRALLREISIQANRIFGEIMGDHSAELAWTNDYEIVLYKNGQERSYAQLSGGEQMSAALAVRLALLRRLSRLDIAFFDEPTQNMDGERRGNLAEQIRRVRGFDQLIVISHDDTFEQGLDSVIHLEKRDGKTVLVENDMLVPA